MTRSSSISSLRDKELLELVWENGQILVRGGSSNRTQNVSITGRTRLSTVYSLLDDNKFPPHNKDSDLSSSHQSSDQHFCQIDLQFSQSNKNSTKLHQEEFAKDPNNNQLCTYSSSQQQQCLPSSPHLKKPRVDSISSQAPATAKKSNTHNLGCYNQRTGKVNFSNFLIPALSHKSSHHQDNTANQPARVEEIEAAKLQKTPAAAAACISKAPEAVGGNSSALRVQGYNNVIQHYNNETSNSASPKAKGMANNEPLLASSSVCSLVASNDPTICIRKHEYNTDDSTYYLSDNDEETEDVVIETPPREVTRVKRGRNAEIHNLSERKRRDNINKKIRALKELIPNCNKMDKASTLDDAIDYLKTLKLQLQIMSMGSRLYNPLMMFPAAMNASHLMGAAGMCFRPPQFPIPPPLSAITDTATLNNMFGSTFSNHMPPISHHHHAPFNIPMNGNPSTPPPLIPPTTTTTTATNLAEHFLNSATLDDLHVNAEYVAAMQATNQVSLHHNNSGYPFYFPTGKEENRDIIGHGGKTRLM